MALIGEEELAVIALWQQSRSGMGGPGHLPFAGGSAEQPAILIEAFRILEGVAAKLKPEKEE